MTRGGFLRGGAKTRTSRGGSSPASPSRHVRRGRGACGVRHTSRGELPPVCGRPLHRTRDAAAAVATERAGMTDSRAARDTADVLPADQRPDVSEEGEASTPAEPAAAAGTTSSPPVSWNALRPLLLRLHFYAGVLIGPFLLVAAVTGLLYTATPQIEAVVYRHELHVTPDGDPDALSAQVAAARRAVPEGTLVSVTPAPGRTDSTQGRLRETGTAGQLHADRVREPVHQRGPRPGTHLRGLVDARASLGGRAAPASEPR
ncbi:PepSY domain-containing protein [Streptomyces tendae]|uniref:PepSY domain-containing protein n=1 Tax=Streptomyces tendae TaxID=1932 RepID=UPI0036470E72